MLYKNLKKNEMMNKINNNYIKHNFFRAKCKILYLYKFKKNKLNTMEIILRKKTKKKIKIIK